MVRASFGIAVLAAASLVVGLYLVTDSLLFIFLAVALAGLAVALFLVGLVVNLVSHGAPSDARDAGPGT